jgi:hypothetical protein
VSDITARLQTEFGPGSGTAEHHEWLVESGPGGAACMLTLRLMELARQPEIVITSATTSGHLTQLSVPLATPEHLEALIESLRHWTCTTRPHRPSAEPRARGTPHKPPGRDAEVRNHSGGAESQRPDEGVDPPEDPGRCNARSPPLSAGDRCGLGRGDE